MNQNPKPSTRQKRPRCEWVDQYLDIYTLKRMPITKTTLERLATDLVKWAKEDEDALVLSEFYLDRGIPHSTFSKLAFDHPIMAEALTTARMFIGKRREKGALKNKLNQAMVMSQQSKYDPSWWTLEKKRAELKASTQAKHNPDVKYAIVVEDFSDKEKK